MDYYIDINCVHIDAEDWEDAEKKYLKMIEDPNRAIGILQEFEVNK